MKRKTPTCAQCYYYYEDIESCGCKGPYWEHHEPDDLACSDFKTVTILPGPPKSSHSKRYKLVPCKADELGMKLIFENEEDEPEDGSWHWWMDKKGNVEYARLKYDAYDHFLPNPSHLELGDAGIYEASYLAGYFKEVE